MTNNWTELNNKSIDLKKRKRKYKIKLVINQQ